MSTKPKDEPRRGRLATKLKRAMKRIWHRPFPGPELELKVVLSYLVIGLLHVALLFV